MPQLPTEPDLVSCATCGVEFGSRASLPTVCPICADDRQWVPADGQRWVTQAQLAESSQVHVDRIGPDQWGVRAAGVGIGQTMQVVRTAGELVLWDPIGLVDTQTVEFLRSLGTVRAIVASHPHMYGAQTTWSRALGDPPVLINAADREWVQRTDPGQQIWSGTVTLTEDVVLYTLGGHFAGSAVLHRAHGSGTVLAGDTMMVNSDRKTVSFMRSYPNRIPLSAAVVERIADAMAALRYDTLWSNFGNAITADAAARVQFSARRHIGWVRGDFDDLC